MSDVSRINWILPVSHRDYNRMPASVWIRCLQLIPYLEELGVRSEINSSESDAPVVVFVRNQSDDSYRLAERFKSAGKKVIFDLCVNYFDPSELSNLGTPVGERHILECKRMVALADLVTCASANIAERAVDFHSRVRYLPDSIDHRHFRFVKNRNDFRLQRIRAVWSGQSNKAVELTPILEMLRKRSILLRLITNSRVRIRRPGGIIRRSYRYEYIPWGYESFPEDILSGEICLSYRETDTPYNRGHSFFKIGTFMAQGVPCLASPVPSYRELLDAGDCGRICRDPGEWEEALDSLGNRDMLVAWSERAVRRMEQYYTCNVAQDYLSLLNSLL